MSPDTAIKRHRADPQSGRRASKTPAVVSQREIFCVVVVLGSGEIGTGGSLRIETFERKPSRLEHTLAIIGIGIDVPTGRKRKQVEEKASTDKLQPRTVARHPSQAPQ
jgi:hypothetical protein